MASISRVARTLAESRQARSLSLVVTPHPVTFAERRSVLEVIRKHGDVNTFRMMPGRFNKFISVTKNEETAQSLVDASPLSYTFTSQRRAFDTNLADFFDSREALPKTSVEIGEAQPATDRKDGQVQKTFTLHISPATLYNHDAAITRDKHHHRWPKMMSKAPSFMEATLEQSLPGNIVAEGLAQWDHNPNDFIPLSRDDRKEERLMKKSWVPSRMKEWRKRKDTKEEEVKEKGLRRASDPSWWRRNRNIASRRL